MSYPNFSAFKAPSNIGRTDIVKILAILLVAQLSLAVILKYCETNYQPVEPTAVLLTCDFQKITKIIIEQNDNASKTKVSLVIEKDKKGWKLPDYFSFPASADKITNMINTLKGLKKGFPISTTANAAEHFHVGADNFEQALSLYNGPKKLNTLYLGASPRFRTTNARLADSNDIFVVPLSQYEITTSPRDWIDRDVAKLNTDDLTSIDTGSFKMEKVGDIWKLITPQKTQSLTVNVAQTFKDAIAHLSIQSVIGPKQDNATNQLLSYKVTLKDGHVVTYTFFKAKDAGSSILKLSNNDLYFAVDDWAVNAIKGFSAESISQSEAKVESDAKKSEPKSVPKPILYPNH